MYSYSFLFFQYNHCQRPHHEKWVFGMVDVSQQPAMGYMEIVQQRDAPTLLPIIQAHARAGIIIHSDQWAAYHNVGTLPGIVAHQTVNHSLEFINPVTSIHIQNVESYWNRVKGKLKHIKGCHAHQLPSYIDMFMWGERYGRQTRRAFINIMADIAAQYPV